MLSIIIPSRNCAYSTRTVQDILAKAKGDIEVIVHIDDQWPETIKDKRVTYIHPTIPRGMRAGINAGLALAKGKYIMKCDDHCLFGEGFDKIITENMQDDWLVIPRRYSLHAEGWRREEKMPIKDYHYLSWPQLYSHYGYCMFPQEWRERTYERMNKPEYDIDETMSFQGSCYFANREYFIDIVGFLDDRLETYSTFACEQLETGLKYWLGGGGVMVNKKTWYAHLFKNKKYYEGRRRDRDYKKNLKTLAGYDWCCKHWMNNQEPNMYRRIGWLIDRFWPVPNWPDNWKELWNETD